MTTATDAPPPRLGRVLTVSGVYRPQSDSLLLAGALRREGVQPGTEVLDIGTGSGALAVYAARLGARVTAVDIGRRAVLTARLNALLARQRITVFRGDLTRSLPAGRYDLVISNPPYVPAPQRVPPRRGAARAWDAGHDGRVFVDHVCDAAPGVLRRNGVLLMVHSGLCDPDRTLLRLTRAGLNPDVVDRLRLPFGPVLRERLPWLRSRGLVGPCANPEQRTGDPAEGMTEELTEELVVVRAERC